MRKVSKNENGSIYSMRDKKLRLWKELESKQIWERRLKDIALSSYIPIGTQNLAAIYTMNLRWNWSISRGHFGACYIFFRSSRNQKSNASNSAQIKVETRKIWIIEGNCAKRNQRSPGFTWTCEISHDCVKMIKEITFVVAQKPMEISFT